jgi:hypothetical protein
MQVAESPLVVAIDKLEEAVIAGADTDRQLSLGLERTLAGVERAIRQHAAAAGPVDELVADLDRPLLPSPGAYRRQAGLRREQAGLLRETHALRKRVEGIGGPAGTAFSPPESQPRRGPLESLFERARVLAVSLATFSKDEVLFIQDSITTDIGAGD